jgi:hypothetical protein
MCVKRWSLVVGRKCGCRGKQSPICFDRDLMAKKTKKIGGADDNTCGREFLFCGEVNGHEGCLLQANALDVVERSDTRNVSTQSEGSCSGRQGRCFG